LFQSLFRLCAVFRSSLGKAQQIKNLFSSGNSRSCCRDCMIRSSFFELGSRHLSVLPNRYTERTSMHFIEYQMTTMKHTRNENTARRGPHTRMPSPRRLHAMTAMRDESDTNFQSIV
jgi:hypothetical protein